MRALTIAGVCLALGSACGGGSSTTAAAPKPNAAPAKPGAPAAEAAAPQQEIVTTVVYSYNPLGKRDPFRSPDEFRRAVANEVQGPCNEPLCQWDLDQLELKAVVTGDANPFAMLEDPKGRGHIVRRNSRVGRQGGKVSQILRDSITVTEYWTQPDGKRASVPKDKKIAEDRGFVPATDLISGKTYE